MDPVILENKKYLSRRVNPILELMIAELMKKQPEDPIEFMKTWLRSDGQEIQAKINNRLRSRPEGIPSSSESEYDEDEDLDDFNSNIETAKFIRKTDFKAQRISVSAEVYGSYNKKEDFKPPSFPKSEDQKQKLYNKLDKSFLFSHLAEKEKWVLVDAMQEKAVQANECVISQGDDGFELYVVDEGELECRRKENKDAENKFLLNYKPGDAFGELALLYNAPRAASITSKTACRLFSLDRETFNFIVKDAVIRRRQNFEEFMSKIPLLDSLNTYEKDKICDCLQTKSYKKDDYIIKEGEMGDVFYFIQYGNCIATKKDPSGDEKVVYEFGEYDYFGELALLKNEPRAANVMVTSEKVEVAFIDRASFKRLLGPLEDILKRNTERYETFVLKNN